MADGNWDIPIIGDIISGLFGAAGQSQQNKWNAGQAQKQMDFQERMSSTAAQRSVKDFTAAGLNPALAYERTASSPGGAQATMGSTLNAGISSAKTSSQFRQDMEIARRTNDADINLKKAQEKAVIADANETAQRIAFTAINQPFDTRNKTATAALQEYMLPSAANEAAWAKRIGEIGPGLSTAKDLTGVLQGLFPKINIFGGGANNTTKHFLMPKGTTP